MRFDFANKGLEALYYEEKGAHRYSESVVNAFFEVMRMIGAAPDERDLRALKSLQYHKLKGNRQHQHSLHLTKKVCLIVEREEDEGGKYLSIVDIEDYH